MALRVKSVKKSRMMGDCQVRFCERLGVKLPRSTRQKKPPQKLIETAPCLLLLTWSFAYLLREELLLSDLPELLLLPEDELDLLTWLLLWDEEPELTEDCLFDPGEYDLADADGFDAGRDETAACDLLDTLFPW